MLIKIKNMIKTIRVIYVLIAYLVFFVASSVAIFFAFGYTYNFSKNTVEKRSVLFVKSYPKNADILLNGIINRKKTPARITYLNPNIYNIEVAKEGYYSWNKQFLIKPNQTVFIEDISLFFKQPKSEILLQGDFKEISISPDLNKIIFINNTDKSLNVFDSTTERSTQIGQNMNDVLNIIWSSDSKKILLQFKDKNLIAHYDFLNSAMLDLKDLITVNTKQISWDKYDSNLLYVVDEKNNTYSLDISTQKITKLEFFNVLTIKAESDKIYYVQKRDNKNYFHVYDKKEKIDKEIFELNASDAFEFLLQNKDYICLFDKSNEKLYLIDPNLNTYLFKTFDNIVSINWDLYNRLLLIQKDFEISIYDVLQNQEILINRFSEPVKNVFWHKNNNHIFYGLGDKLYISEIDIRDKKNVFYLENIYSSDKISSNRKGNILYHITSSGIVKDTIQ